MKILKIQESHNLQFASNSTGRVKTAIVKGFPKKGDPSEKSDKILLVSHEIQSRIEEQIRKSKRKQTYDTFNALQKEKDIKYKNMLG